MILGDEIDKHFDIHYQEYVELVDAKMDVIDHKLIVLEILVVFLNLNKSSIKVMLKELVHALTSIINLIC
jgi:hypothetical protein